MLRSGFQRPGWESCPLRSRLIGLAATPMRNAVTRTTKRIHSRSCAPFADLTNEAPVAASQSSVCRLPSRGATGDGVLKLLDPRIIWFVVRCPQLDECWKQARVGKFGGGAQP